MDFIERIFGVSPDGGSGATEAMVIVAVIAMGSLIYFRRQQQRKSRRSNPEAIGVTNLNLAFEWPAKAGPQVSPTAGR